MYVFFEVFNGVINEFDFCMLGKNGVVYLFFLEGVVLIVFWVVRWEVVVFKYRFFLLVVNLECLDVFYDIVVGKNIE